MKSCDTEPPIASANYGGLCGPGDGPIRGICTLKCGLPATLVPRTPPALIEGRDDTRVGQMARVDNNLRFLRKHMLKTRNKGVADPPSSNRGHDVACAGI